ncbi:MAG: DUF935 family protein [Selenomonadaceae bacterium]|nr:DUF935 family protein [Selenomonadaceae bacterium]MBQ3434362.1 DUF935 family protein [Selenomonadaceae bacterium]MBR0289272.1 DUF935 family protein [Selenomonadaceae bacterium]
MTNKEIGRTGTKRYGGILYEEFLQELRGINGVQVYREMSSNDDTVGSILFAIKMLIRQAEWSVMPASEDAADKKAAEFVESCLHDMDMPWTDVVGEILSCLTYGWSLHEIVYKRRMGRKRDPRLESKFDDGLIGWQKLPIRSQESLYKWEFDDCDNLTAFVQMPAPDFEIIRIPAEKFLLFRAESDKGNPEGRSILRNAYRSWFHKKRIQEIEGIGIERDLAGFPVLVAPAGMADIWNDSEQFSQCLEFVQNIRRDAMEGFVLPGGWELKLLSTGGARQFDTNAIIQRYDVAIARTVLADFIFLGHEATGSWALSSDKTRLFAMAIGAFLDSICATFNRKAIPALIDINGGKFAGISDYPQLVHGDVETNDLEKLAVYLKEMAGIGLITPDDSLEEYIREQASLPPKTEA